MMKKTFFSFLILLFILIATKSMAESPSLLWPTTIEGKWFLPQACSDGENGILLFTNNIVRYSETSNSNSLIANLRTQVRRIGANGNVLWVSDLIPSFPSYSLGKSVARASDGNYLCGSFVLSTSEGNAMLIGKADYKSIKGGTALFDYVSDGSQGFYGVGKNGSSITVERFGFNYPSGWYRSFNRTLNFKIGSVSINGGMGGGLYITYPSSPEGGNPYSMSYRTHYPVINATENGCVFVWQESATPEFHDVNQSSIVYLAGYSSRGELYPWSPLRVSSIEGGDFNATAESYASVPVVVGSGGGEVVIFWAQGRRSGNLYGAKVNTTNGNILWRKKFESISGIYQIKAVSDANNYYVAYLGDNLYFAGFDSNGNLLSGYPLLISNDASSFHLMSDKQGGVILTYYKASTIEGYVCRVDLGRKSVVWDKKLGNSFSLLSIPFSSPTSESFLISFPELENINSTKIKVRNIRISDGSTLWEQTIVAEGFNYEPIVIGDGEGGAIVCFWNRDYGVISSNIFARRIYAQRVGSQGKLWQEPVIVDTSTENDLMATALFSGDDVGRAHVWYGKYWEAQSNFIRVLGVPAGGIYGQKLRYYDGNKRWGRILSRQLDNEPRFLSVAPDESGGGVFVWHVENSIYAQWVDKDGNLLLGSEEVLVESDSNIGFDLPRVSCIGDKALIYWRVPSRRVIKIRSLTKERRLGPTIELSGTFSFFDTFYEDKVKGGKLYLPSSVDDRSICYVIKDDGSEFARVNTPVGSNFTNFVQICADDNNLYLAYPFPTSKGIGCYINRVPFSSINNGSNINLSTTDAWAVFSKDASFESFFPCLFSIVPDYQGGVVAIWTDFRNLSSSEVSELSSLWNSAGDLEGVILNPIFGNFSFDVYAQRLDSNGNQLWGETGFLIASGIKAQLLIYAVASRNPVGSAIFSYLDASRVTPGYPLWVMGALTKVQKVGPSSAGVRKVTTITVDGRPLSGGILTCSSKPKISLSTPNYLAIQTIEVYVNGEVKYRKTGGFTELNDLSLDLTQAGTYDVRVVLKYTDGDESVISFTLYSLGAQTVGIVGEMTAAYASADGNATISYVLASDTNARLVIVSPMGELVMNRTFAAGTPGGMASYNAVVWDGKLPSGEKAGTGIYPVKLFDATTGKELGKTYIVVK